jgi:hypothetical protein
MYSYQLLRMRTMNYLGMFSLAEAFYYYLLLDIYIYYIICQLMKYKL